MSFAFSVDIDDFDGVAGVSVGVTVVVSLAVVMVVSLMLVSVM